MRSNTSHNGSRMEEKATRSVIRHNGARLFDIQTGKPVNVVASDDNELNGWDQIIVDGIANFGIDRMDVPDNCVISEKGKLIAIANVFNWVEL